MGFKNLTLKGALCSPKRNIPDAQLDRLKESEFPNYIFGGGSGAISVANMLIANGISVDGFFESPYYYQEDRRLLDKPVYRYDEAGAPSMKRNLIIGASGKSIHSVIAMEKKLGNDIYVFDTTKPLFHMSYEWVCGHLDELEQTLKLFEDDLSRETFLSFIDDKAHCIVADVRPLWELWVSDQYFNDLYVFDNYDTHSLVDCGAWIGDTAEEYLCFLRDLGGGRKVLYMHLNRNRTILRSFWRHPGV